MLHPGWPPAQDRPTLPGLLPCLPLSFEGPFLMLWASSFTEEETKAQKDKRPSLRWLSSLDNQGHICTSPMRILSNHIWLALDPCPIGSWPICPPHLLFLHLLHIWWPLTVENAPWNLLFQPHQRHVKHLTLKLNFHLWLSQPSKCPWGQSDNDFSPSRCLAPYTI